MRALLDDKIFTAERTHSSRQLPDFYLLALAAKYGGMLATFDQSIPISAVRIANVKNLCVLVVQKSSCVTCGCCRDMVGSLDLYIEEAGKQYG